MRSLEKAVVACMEDYDEELQTQSKVLSHQEKDHIRKGRGRAKNNWDG